MRRAVVHLLQYAMQSWRWQIPWKFLSVASDMSGLGSAWFVRFFEPGDHMLPEVRMARVLDAIVSHRAGRLSCVEAGELLGLSERHFRRLRDAYEDRGEEGLVDRRRGRVSSSRIPEALTRTSASIV